MNIINQYESAYQSPRINQPDVIGNNVFYNAFPFWRHLHTFDFVWATTFTFDPISMDSLPLQKVICTKIKHGIAPKSVQVRMCSNLHAKLCICWMGTKIDSVFCGSWNLVAPTWLEVVTKIPKSEYTNCRDYFEELWHQAKEV